MTGELHISSLIVHARTAERDRIVADLTTLPGVEVHAADEHGRLVVTLETAGTAELIEHIDRINRIEGVLSAVLVYHHSESLDSLEEEINHESHAPGIR